MDALREKIRVAIDVAEGDDEANWWSTFVNAATDAVMQILRAQVAPGRWAEVPRRSEAQE